jgi:hypothetical protein
MTTRFKQADLERAVKACEKAGVRIGRVRIEPNGAIEIVAGEGEKDEASKWFADSPLYRNVA